MRRLIYRIVLALSCFILNRQKNNTGSVDMSNALSSVEAFLIYRYDRLGDAVLTLPLVFILRKCFPGRPVYLLCSKNNNAVSTLVGEGVHVVSVRDLGMLKNRSLAVIDPFYKSWTKSFQLYLTLKPEVYIGFCKGDKYGLSFRDFCLMDRCVPFDERKRVIDNWERFVSMLSCNIDWKAAVRESGRQLVVQASCDELKPPQEKYILVCPHGSAPFRRFDGAFLARLAQVLRDIFPDHAVYFSSVHPLEEASLSLLKTPDLRSFVCAIHQSSLVISVDSAPVHIASLLDVPILGIFFNYKSTGHRFLPFSSCSHVVYVNRADEAGEQDLNEIIQGAKFMRNCMRSE